jgi:hypothetical protein
MHYTWSFACSCVLEDAQTTLLALATAQLTPPLPTYTTPSLEANVPEVL